MICKLHLGSAVLVLASLIVAGDTTAKDAVVSVDGRDAPIHDVIEAFLSLASSAYADPDPEAFKDFCAEFSIDSDWPSAGLLGSAFTTIREEWAARLSEARELSSYTDSEGQDPNAWKTEEMGRVVGQIYEQLRGDGFKSDLGGFIKMIEARVRGSFTLHSDKPLTETAVDEEVSRFWGAMAEETAEAINFQTKEVRQ